MGNNSNNMGETVPHDALAEVPTNLIEQQRAGFIIGVHTALQEIEAVLNRFTFDRGEAENMQELNSDATVRGITSSRDLLNYFYTQTVTDNDNRGITWARELLDTEKSTIINHDINTPCTCIIAISTEPEKPALNIFENKAFTQKLLQQMLQHNDCIEWLSVETGYSQSYLEAGLSGRIQWTAEELESLSTVLDIESPHIN